MDLKIIEYGSLASSEIMNNNFSYLDEKIETNSEATNTSISSLLSNIATINTRLNDLVETFSDSIEAVNSNKVKRILCFGELFPKEKDILIYIEDFNKLPDYYLALKENKRIKICEECKKIFIDSSKNNLQRKCQDCKKIKKTKKTERKFCIDCNKEIFIKYNNQASQIRCKECQKKLENQKKVEKYQQIAMKTKIIICEDCNKQIEVPSTYRRTRCDDCYKIYRKNKINENAKKYYKEKYK